MKKALIILVLVAILLMLTGYGKTAEGRIVTAKIRYFDGSCDTVVIDRWFLSQSGTVTLFTESGRKVVIGVNNVILIDETTAQYENREEVWP